MLTPSSESLSFRAVGHWGDLSGNGHLWTDGGGQEADRFDLSSLTKPILTSSLLMMTCERSQYSWENFLDLPISEWIVELENTPLKDIKLQHLWEHRSGLAAHIDFLSGAVAGHEPQRASLPKDWSREQAWQKILAGIIEQTTSGGLDFGGSVYSDLGFLLLGLGLERFYGRSLSELWMSWKNDHGISAFALPFFEQKKSIPGLVPTESRHATGEVNDNNAFFLGGVAPHASLLGSTSEIWHWMQAVKTWCANSPKIAQWLKVPSDWSWRFYCGWDRPGDPATTLAGRGAPQDTVGHLGYSGTAFWWSPSKNLAGVLLTNRIHPKPNQENAEMIKILRREFFSGLWQGTLNSEWQIPIKKNGPT